MKRPLHVCMLVFEKVGKGAYWRALQPAIRLVQRGHHVTLIAMGTSRWQKQVFIQEGVRVVATPDLLWGKLRSGWDLWESWYRIRWLSREKFDLVHFFESRPTVLFPALYMKYCRHVPVINDWSDWFGRGGSVEERPNFWIRTILRPIETFFEECYRPYVDGITVVCTRLEQKAKALGISPEKTLFWRDGADTDGLQLLDKMKCREMLELPTDKVLIGYIGAIFYQDAHLMAQAFDQLQQLYPASCLVLAGYMNFPVENMVAQPSAVIRTGYLDYADVNRYLAACDICWLPFCNSQANQGRYPTKLNDYMAVGRPTIATPVGDVAHIVSTYQIGLLADNAQSLATQTAYLIHNVEMREQLGKNARQLAEGAFNWEQRTDDLETFYYQVLKM